MPPKKEKQADEKDESQDATQDGDDEEEEKQRKNQKITPDATPKKTAKAKAQQKAKAKAKTRTSPQKVKKSIPKKSVKPKSKSKGTPKGAGKGKQQMKRPAAAAKPKAKAKAKYDPLGQIKEWKGGLATCEDNNEVKEEGEGEEEDTLEVDPIVDVAEPVGHGEVKDRLKDRKFKALLDGGQLPSFIVNEYQKICKMKSGERQAERELINNTIDRKAGSLVLSTQKPFFEQMKKNYTTEESSNKNRSLPRSLFCGKFNLSKEAFEEGLRMGDFTEGVDEDNRPVYTWRESEVKHAVGTSTSSSISKKKKIEGKDDMGLAQIAMKPKFPEQGLLQCLGATGSKEPLALEDQTSRLPSGLSEEMWTTATKQLKEAGQALDKLDKEAKRLLLIVGADDKDNPVFTSVSLGLQ